MAQELIVFVDRNNNERGTGPKLDSHNAHTRLHRAFSVFVFDRAGRFLLTQRALSKKVFPGVWTNSCCGHPGPGESTEDAIRRRMQYELGTRVSGLVVAVPKFIYRCKMNGVWEHEFCPVYLARADADPAPNPAEVEAYEWVEWDDFVERVEQRPSSLSHWSVRETRKLTAGDAVKRFLAN